MDDSDFSRRDFLIRTAAGASAAWISANWPAILEAHQHAQHAAQAATPPKFEFFTPEQAAEVEAIAAQIIPTDDSPGAREARVIYFMDRALTSFDSSQQKAYTEGLPQLQAKVKELYPDVTKFSAATSEQQIAVLKAVEKTPFFGVVRGHAVMGFLADPARGGNFEQVGWKHINFTSDHVYKPRKNSACTLTPRRWRFFRSLIPAAAPACIAASANFSAAKSAPSPARWPA